MRVPVTSFIALPAVRRFLPELSLLTGLLLCPCAHAATPDTQADIGYMFNDNVTRAKEGGAKQADRSCTVNLSRPVIFPLTGHTRAVLTGALNGEVFDRNTGLNRFTETVLGEFQYRSSAEFGAPLFALSTKISADQYQSGLRSGFRYSAGISIQQAVTDRIRFFAAVAHNERKGNNEVFNNKDNSARINLDYSPGVVGTIYLGGEHRRGDLTVSAPEFWGQYNANAYAQDDAFSGGQIYSFRFDGTSTLLTLGYNLAIGPRDAIDFFWRQSRSAVNYVTPSWSNATLSYVTNQYSVAYLLRF